MLCDCCNMFVMNHIDRVDCADVEGLLDDLRTTLDSDGISGAPPVLTTAADPPLGEPVGIDGFIEAMHSLGTAKAVVERRLIADLDGSLEAQPLEASEVSLTGIGA